MRHGWLGLIVATCWSLVQAEPLPAAAFTTAPELREPQLSPDGRQLAALVRQNGRQALVLRELTEPPTAFRPVFVAEDPELSLRSLRWLDGERLLLSVRDGKPLRGSDVAQDALMVIWPGKNESVNLYNGAGAPVRWNNQRDTLVDSAHTDAGFVLMMGADPRLKGHQWGVYRIDTRTAQRSRAASGLYGALRFWADRDGQVRMALRRDGGRLQLLQRRQADAEWQLLRDWAPTEPTPWFALGFGEQLDAFYVRSGDQVLRLDLGQPDAAPVPVAQEPALQRVTALLREPRSGRVLGASGPGVSRYWDAAPQAKVLELGQRLQGQNAELQQWLGTHYLAASSRDDQPARYWLGMPEAKRFELLSEARPALRELPAVERRTLHPAGAGPVLLRRAKGLPGPLPLVWCLACGLESADSADSAFNPLLAFLLTRGFAVATPQFSGGLAPQTQGLLPWAAEQLPLHLAALKALRQHEGLSNQSPILFGHDLGGYLALRLAAELADQGGVAALITVGAPTDLVAHLARLNEARFTEATRQGVDRLLGAASTAELRAASPVQFAARLPDRLLIVQGERNGIVHPQQAADLAAAVQATGRQPRLLRLPGANHEISHGPERRQVLEAMESLLRP